MDSVWCTLKFMKQISNEDPINDWNVSNNVLKWKYQSTLKKTVSVFSVSIIN